MVTECYAQVRGSALRVTRLDACGEVTSPVEYAVSTAVAKVVLTEDTDGGGSDTLRVDLTDEPRLTLNKATDVIRLKADVAFLRVDPGVLNIVAAVPVVLNAQGDTVGFDSNTRLPAAAFGMEVWSKIAADRACVDPLYGYTLFPYLRGGWLSGFEFKNGLVSFSLTQAQVRLNSLWGYGPYDLEGPGQRLLDPVGKRTMYRNMLTTGTPPEQTAGIVSFVDEVDGGSAAFTSSDAIDGEFVTTSLWVLDGGLA